MKSTLPKETLEDKKLIAEKVLDWIYNSVWDTFTESIDESPKSGLLSAHFFSSGIHFYEAIGKLNKTLRRKLEFKLRDENDDYLALYHSTSDLSICLYVESHKPEIIQALLVILKEGKSA